MNARGAHVQEELRSAWQVACAVEAPLATQAIELEEQVLLARPGEELRRGVQLAAPGTARQRLVAEHGARRDLDDRFVHRVDPTLDHQLEELRALPP